MKGGASGFQNARDRKSTRLNSSHVSISYAVFCLKKKRAIELRRQDGTLIDTRISISLVNGKTLAVLTLAGSDVVGGSLACGSYALTFFFNGTPPPEIYTLSLHDALPIYSRPMKPTCATSSPSTRRNSTSKWRRGVSQLQSIRLRRAAQRARFMSRFSHTARPIFGSC